MGLPWWLSGKKETNKQKLASAGYTGLIPGPGRFSGEGNGNPLRCSCQEIPWTEEPGWLQSMG